MQTKVILTSQFASVVPYLFVSDCTSCRVGAMNLCVDHMILMSQFASGVPYIGVSGVVIVQAVVWVQCIIVQTQ